jgi:alkylation response protein AidB-like acyl-CoA dehydrogenase
LIKASIKLKQFLENEVEPHAASCDVSFEVLHKIFLKLGHEKLYALSIRSELENNPLDKKTRFDNKAIETKASGALSFLTSQINLSSSLIHFGNNEHAKQTLLPRILQGDLRIANAVSHLRNSIPSIQVQSMDHGFLLNGTIKWLTGFGHFEQFILGFTFEDKEYYAILPFAHQDNLQLSAPLQVMAMQAAQTVNGVLNSYFLPEENIINVQNAGDWNQQMRTNHHILPYFYGIGMGALEILQEKFHAKNSVYEPLTEELSMLRDDITSNAKQDYITLRVKITNCAWKCLIAAIIASKGQAMDPNSKVSRLYREIVQFNSLATIPEYISQQLEVKSNVQ